MGRKKRDKHNKGNGNILPQDKVIAFLKSRNIHTSYQPHNFSNGTNEYARFELTLSERLKAGLEADLNAHFHPECGDTTNGRFIQLREINAPTNTYKYVLEIVPDERLPLNPQQKEEATEKFLTSLPHQLKAYLKKCTG